MQSKYVEINWENQFGGVFGVRRVLSIEEHKDGYGDITSSSHIPRVFHTSDYCFLAGDVYVIGNLDKDWNDEYHLVQIDVANPEGYRLIDSFKHCDAHPTHENRLARGMLGSPEVLKYLMVKRYHG